MLPLENIVNSQVQAPRIARNKRRYLFSKHQVGDRGRCPPPHREEVAGEPHWSLFPGRGQKCLQGPSPSGARGTEKAEAHKTQRPPLWLTDATNFLEIKSSPRACCLGSCGRPQAGGTGASGRVLRGSGRSCVSELAQELGPF